MLLLTNNTFPTQIREDDGAGNAHKAEERAGRIARNWRHGCYPRTESRNGDESNEEQSPEELELQRSSFVERRDHDVARML